MKDYRVFSRSIVSLAIAASLLFTIAAPAQISAKSLSDGNQTKTSALKHSKQVLHLKLRADSGVSVSAGTFVGGPADETAKLNTILSSAKRIKADKLDTSVKLPNTPSAQPELQAKLKDAVKNYYKVTFAKDIDMTAIVSQLKDVSIVETAYPESLPVAPPATPNYTSLQNYLQASPKGTDANFASTFPGGAGDKVSIIDLEYSWNVNHEDLAKAKTALIPNGTPADYYNDNNHGTSVLGELVATKNSFGVTGAAPNVNLGLVNTYNTERGWDPLNAMMIAAWVTKPGDVILIEQQAVGPNGNYVPMEWTPEIYDYIKVLTSAGRIVIEPAGNGGQNLDDVSLYGTSFPLGKADSGAILVGAGNNCSGQTPLSRFTHTNDSYSSNYGKRVNLQGPGNCVVTTGVTGPGDTFGSQANPNALYTNGFAGTSAAAPIVAAAAASLSSSYKTLNNGAVLTPAQIRTILAQTGVAQNTSAGTAAGNIGPYPNLAAALLKADITAPKAVTGLAYKLNSTKKPILTWKATTDNYKLASYRVYRDNALITTTTALTYTDKSTVKNKTYSYKIVAVDVSGNVSAATTLSVSTK